MIPRLSPNIELSQFSKNFLKSSTVAEFEKAFAELSSSRFAIAFPYGRTAILCLLKALGLHRKKILCPAFTCVVVPHAITFCEIFLIFIDILEVSFFLDFNLASVVPSLIRRSVRSSRPQFMVNPCPRSISGIQEKDLISMLFRIARTVFFVRATVQQYIRRAYGCIY